MLSRDSLTEPHLDGKSVGKPRLDAFYICLMRRFHQHMVSLMCVTGFLLPLCPLCVFGFHHTSSYSPERRTAEGTYQPFYARLLL